jgi:hypothetical protein
MKTLNQFTIEAAKSYLKVKSPDEQRFVDKHVVAKHQDNNGNGDDVFNASKVKTIKRNGERHGYDSGDDEKVYEQKMDKPDIKDGALVKGNKLSGDRYKIDANKNGEIDAEDLKLLRLRKKKMKEEVEDLDEVLKPSMGVKSYIDDFIKSKNPKFEGDTKKQRIKRAVAAYYSDLRGEGLELPDNVIESLVDTFDQLSEGNQEVFIEMSESEDGINQLIDFIIANRGN